MLTGVTEEMDVCREETFGPLVSIYPVDTLDEAVERANDTEYGLNASVFIDDVRAGPASSPSGSWPARSTSTTATSRRGPHRQPDGWHEGLGLGRRHGKEGLLKYTEAQTIAVRSGPGREAAGHVSRPAARSASRL